jgi:hypothetical protein
MQTITVQAEVSADGMLKLEVPCDAAPGRVDVVLTIQPHQPDRARDRINWAQLSGLGKDVWQGVDAQSYLSDLRADRDSAT